MPTQQMSCDWPTQAQGAHAGSGLAEVAEPTVLLFLKTLKTFTLPLKPEPNSHWV